MQQIDQVAHHGDHNARYRAHNRRERDKTRFPCSNEGAQAPGDFESIGHFSNQDASAIVRVLSTGGHAKFDFPVQPQTPDRGDNRWQMWRPERLLGQAGPLSGRTGAKRDGKVRCTNEVPANRPKMPRSQRFFAIRRILGFRRINSAGPRKRA
jgi:hypothetical protein